MDYVPRETMDVILRRWLVVVLCTLAGGVLGWVFHQLQPPIYEAHTVFTISINYNQPDLLDSLDKNNYAEDQMVSAAMDLIISSPVAQKAAQDAAPLHLGPDDLVYNRRVFLERRQSEVTLIVRNEDPQKASQLANLWAQRGLEALQEAAVHARRVYTLNYSTKALANCLQAKPEAAGGLCAQTSLGDLNQELQKSEAELTSEMQASKGLTPAILFDWSQQAGVPQSPVLYQTQGLALAGALVGFLIGLLLSILRIK